MPVEAWGMLGTSLLFLGTLFTAVLTYKASRQTSQASTQLEEKKQRLDEIDQIIKGQSGYIKQLEMRLDNDKRWFDSQIARMTAKLERCELDKERLKVRIEALEAKG